MESDSIPKGIASKYEIEKVLSRSHFATVYLARQVTLDRKVVIKVLAPHIAQEASAMKRFQREAKILAELDDPGVTRIYDFGEEGKSAFIISEFVPGETLAEILTKRGKLPVPEVLSIGKEVAEILSRIHKKGILHRDIKPSNIIIKEDGQIKLTDFGLAQSFRIERLTLEGEIIGTPAYMAPEQISGKGIDFRSDIFSLGVVLYELLTGENPFVAETFTGVFHKILYQEVSLSPLPEEIRSLLSRMLAKVPERRFSSAEELRREIGLLLGEPQTAPSLRKSLSYFISARFGFFIALAVIFIILLHLFLSQQRRNRERIEIPLELLSPVKEETLRTERDTTKEMLTGEKDREKKKLAEIFPVFDSGYLWIYAEPWAEIYLGDTGLGETPFASPFKLPAGEVKIKFSHPEFGTYEKTFSVSGNETTKVFFDFKSYLAGLKISAFPWAKIYLDGKYRGETPIGVIYIPPGWYELKLLNPNFSPYLETLEVKAGEVVERSIRW